MSNQNINPAYILGAVLTVTYLALRSEVKRNRKMKKALLMQNEWITYLSRRLDDAGVPMDPFDEIVANNITMD
jgi:hypothetical protein